MQTNLTQRNTNNYQAKQHTDSTKMFGWFCLVITLFLLFGAAYKVQQCNGIEALIMLCGTVFCGAIAWMGLRNVGEDDAA